MGPFKAPGLDGLHPIFLQFNWESLGGSACDKVLMCFDILLVFISVVMNFSNMTQFRSISLCIVVYKTNTKIISTQLKKLCLFLSLIINVVLFWSDMVPMTLWFPKQEGKIELVSHQGRFRKSV